MQILKLPSFLTNTALLLSLVILASCGQSSPSDAASKEKTSDDKGELKLSLLAQQGKVAFDKNCAQCHGLDVMGTDMGPPLVHEIYNPGHHGDNAFFSAITKGSLQHHWQFGNMPPRPEVKDSEIGGIIQYVRELQVAHGIVYKQHRM